jgi:hypothetical protein
LKQRIALTYCGANGLQSAAISMKVDFTRAFLGAQVKTLSRARWSTSSVINRKKTSQRTSFDRGVGFRRHCRWRLLDQMNQDVDF